TYAELDALSDQYARHLLNRGIGPEKVVGCWAHNSCTTVVFVLSVLKAGGAYLLLDPNLPTERLRYILADSAPACILADKDMPSSAAERHTVLYASGLALSSLNSAVAARWPKVGGENLAYVAYTSGSTGKPKGVLITHGATVNHARAFSELFSLGPADRLPLLAPLAFDMATEEMIPPLVSGCTLVDAPTRSPSMEEFTRDVIDNAYTILNLPAPLWQRWSAYLYDAGLPVPPKLRLVIAGSEKIHTDQFRLWQTLPNAAKVRWVTAYGVTEAAVTSTFYLTAAEDDLHDEPLMPIGTPIAGVSTYVLAEDGTPSAVGEVGDLYIGGAGVARGYQNLPEKTSERFVPDPFCATPAARMYATGDRVRRRADGALVWLGRNDSQIKIDGLRIDPAEIEAAICAHPATQDAVVIFNQPTTNLEAGTLTAFIEPKSGRRLDDAKLGLFLASRLPQRMIPGEIVIVDHLPLNANGKIDRKALGARPRPWAAQ
ncbi:MAG TPA: amino acid adenylation domain-containing protein, partial [Candidatus Saccharimonas sp.]|nr:amino acid adenylation domain-containing protein [Candidatus Saccharimonas sp.]